MLTLVFIPGLLCPAELFTPQVAALWPHGPMTIASTLEGETIAQMATAILAQAQAQLVTVPECGHASTLEQPQAVNYALQEWLRR